MSRGRAVGPQVKMSLGSLLETAQYRDSYAKASNRGGGQDVPAQWSDLYLGKGVSYQKTLQSRFGRAFQGDI